jgi:myo-inositol-1(or 4)-monophosphatase
LPASEPAALRGPLEAIMREAGAIARETRRGDFKHWTKNDRSPVSEADIAVNELLHKRLTALVPGAGWLSEETTQTPGPGTPEVWIVDPIDGTRAFIAGRADWTISVALGSHGRPVVASVYAPVTDEMFLVSQHGGGTLNGAPIRVTDGGDLNGWRLAGPRRYLDRFSSLIADTKPQPKFYSLALRMARVAHGELDVAFAGPGAHDWDLAASDLLVHEAGGMLSDFSGRPPTYNNNPDATQGALVAAGPLRHGAVIGLARDRGLDLT